MVKFLFVLITLLAWSEGWAQEGALVLNPKLDSADQAMRSGDISTLNSMLAAEPTNSAKNEMLRAYISRVRGDFDNSDEHAIRCAEIAKSSLPGDYDINYKCKSLLAGNALLRGDYPKWSSLVHSATNDVEKLVRKTVLAEAPGQYTKDVEILAPAATSVPRIGSKSPTFAIDDTNTVLKRVFLTRGAGNDTPRSEPFRVNAELNGVPAVFAFDTGGSATVIGGKTALALGLSPNGNSGHISYDLTFESRQVDVFFSKIKILKLGSFTASNIIVLVSDDPTVENVIGLDLIQGMGQIKFSSSQIDLLDNTECSGELRIASDLFAGTKIVMGLVEIDGKSVPVDIDTGNGEQLAFYSSDSLRRPTEASVQGLPSKVHRVLKKNNDIGSAYNLGNEILNYYNMTIDVRKGRFCLDKIIAN